MASMSIWHWLIILAVVVFIFGTKRFSRIDKELLRSQIEREPGRMPVYSAETTNGKEAEFIRDRLPRRFPTVLALVIAAVLVAVAWRLTR